MEGEILLYLLNFWSQDKMSSMYCRKKRIGLAVQIFSEGTVNTDVSWHLWLSEIIRQSAHMSKSHRARDSSKGITLTWCALLRKATPRGNWVLGWWEYGSMHCADLPMWSSLMDAWHDFQELINSSRI